jgi:ABC-type sugar transport system permease subunit/WD40 repeat protein
MVRWGTTRWILRLPAFAALLACCLLPAAARAANVQVWTLTTKDIVYSVSTAADASLTAIGSRDSTAYVLDAQGKLLWKYVTGNAVTCVAVSPDGAFVAVGSADSALTLLDRSGKVIWKKTVSGQLGAVALTPGASLVVYGINDTASLTKDEHLYLLDHGGHQRWKASLSGSALSVAITPDGKRIVVGADDDSITLLDGAGSQLWQQGGGDRMDGVAISRDGSRVIGGSEDHLLYVYDRAGTQLWTHTAGDKIHAVAISADAKRIAYASEDGNVTLLNGTGGGVFNKVTGHLGYAVALSADAGTIVYGLDNGVAAAISTSGQLAASQAAERDFYMRLAIGIALVLLLLGLYVLYLRATPRGRVLAVRQTGWLRRVRKALWRARISYLMLIPTFAILGVFNYYPAVSGLYHSLTIWNDDGSSHFIGLDNFRAMGRDPYLTNGFTNLAILLISGLIKTIVFPLIVAEIIYHLRSSRAQYWIRTAFIVPTIVPAVATIRVWRFIYDPNLGLLNQALESMGLRSLTHSWLGETATALGAVIFVGFPWITALPLLVLYAGLLAIPGEVLESATVDGAGTLRRIWSMHLPLILGQIKLLMILTFIGGIQDFAGILILTGGGPLDSTYVPSLEMYYNITRFSDKGFAAAIGVVLFAAILVVTLIQLRFVRSTTEYEA